MSIQELRDRIKSYNDSTGDYIEGDNMIDDLNYIEDNLLFNESYE